MARWHVLRTLQRRVAQLPRWQASGETILWRDDEGGSHTVATTRDEATAKLIVDIVNEFVYVINVLLMVRNKIADRERMRKYGRIVQVTAEEMQDAEESDDTDADAA